MRENMPWPLSQELQERNHDKCPHLNGKTGCEETASKAPTVVAAGQRLGGRGGDPGTYLAWRPLSPPGTPVSGQLLVRSVPQAGEMPLLSSLLDEPRQNHSWTHRSRTPGLSVPPGPLAGGGTRRCSHPVWQWTILSSAIELKRNNSRKPAASLSPASSPAISCEGEGRACAVPALLLTLESTGFPSSF